MREAADASKLVLAIGELQMALQHRIDAVLLMQMKLALNELQIPRVFILVRPPGSLQQMFAKLRRPSRWLCAKYYLFFICPVTRTLCATNGGKGYSLQMPYGWVRKYGRAIHFALQCCKVMNTLAKGVLPVPNVVKSIEKEVLHALETPSLERFMEDLQLVLEDCEEDDSTALSESTAATRGQPDVQHVMPATGASYRALAALLRSQRVDSDMQQCGCELMPSSSHLGADCAVEWVSPQGAERFREQGARALFWNQQP